MEGFYMLLGLAMYAGNIICTIHIFGGMKTAPKWLLITAGIMNIFVIFSLYSAYA